MITDYKKREKLILWSFLCNKKAPIIAIINAKITGIILMMAIGIDVKEGARSMKYSA